MLASFVKMRDKLSLIYRKCSIVEGKKGVDLEMNNGKLIQQSTRDWNGGVFVPPNQWARLTEAPEHSNIHRITFLSSTGPEIDIKWYSLYILKIHLINNEISHL